jgi:hypothetical protein
MMSEDKPNFAYQKKIGISYCFYGDIPEMSKMIARLLYCMKECNEKNAHSCEFFRLDFRPAYFDETFEFPFGFLILDLKWGCQEELKKINDEKVNDGED